jgi:RAP1 GTPase activating protein 1
VERKRHLGNDVVVLIFKEGNTPFNPLCIKSHFNHVFLVVQVVKPEESLGDSNGSDAKTRYKLYIANKPGVVPHGPFLPFPPIFEKNEDFRDFLLTKLINAERAGTGTCDFDKN